jgi:hypothetical protein
MKLTDGGPEGPALHMKYVFDENLESSSSAKVSHIGDENYFEDSLKI